MKPKDKEYYEDLETELSSWGIRKLDRFTSPEEKQNASTILKIAADGILTMEATPLTEPTSDMIDPLVLDLNSPLHNLLTFPPIVRMFGVGQLGIQRLFPFPNFTSRGQHVAQLGLEALKMAIKHKLTREDQLKAFIGGVMHDLHPAFGEAGKMAMGISEPDLVEYYFEDRFQIFWRRWLQRVRIEFTVDFSIEELRSYITNVVNRQDKSLPGMMTHGPNKSELDLDFWVYTVTDADIHPFIYLSNIGQTLKDIDLENPDFIRRMERLKRMLSIYPDLEDIYGGDRITLSLEEIDIRPYIVFIDNHLVVTDHTRLERLVRLSAILYTDYYLNPNVLGPEIMFTTIINQKPDIYPVLRDFVELNDQDIFKLVKGTPLAEWIEDPDKHHGWQYVDSEHLHRYPQSNYLVVESRLPQINLRLSTRVRDELENIAPWHLMYPERAVSLRGIEQLSGEPIFLVWKK